MGAEHQLIDGKDNSDPPYQGELRANPASCRVAVKAGFREEGVRRGAALHADGWHDMHVHALLADDDQAAL